MAKIAYHPHSFAVSYKSKKTGKKDNIIMVFNDKYWEAKTDDAWEDIAYSYLVASGNMSHITDANAVSSVKALKHHLDPMPEKDENKIIVPCLNGYVHIDRGSVVLKPHDINEGIEYLIDCEFVPNQPSPLFNDFLNQILPSKAVQSRVQEYVGYTLIQDARFQRAQMWRGSGANGKGVLANIVQALHSKVSAVQLNAIDGFKMSSFVGASLIYADECPTKNINEQLIKTLVAGETVLIDRKYRDPVSTKIQAKWLILANHMPHISDHSDGFWRRFDIVPFDTTIPEGKRDALLSKKIISSELSGVLNWAIEGLIRLLKRGHFDITLPTEMVEAQASAKRETNSVESWWHDCEIQISSEAEVFKDEVYTAYQSWCKRSGMSPLASTKFWGRIKQDHKNVVDKRNYGEGKGYKVNIVLPKSDAHNAWLETQRVIEETRQFGMLPDEAYLQYLPFNGDEY